MNTSFQLTALVALASASACAQAAQGLLTVNYGNLVTRADRHYTQPASRSEEGLPVGIELQEATRDLAQRCYSLMDQRSLPHAPQFTVQSESGRRPASFNLTSAVYHISGTNSFTFESPHGLTNATACHVTLEQILDIQLTLYEAMIRFELAQKPQ